MSRYATALITGGTTGIGAAIAKRLADGGTKVAICGRRMEMLDHMRPVLGERGIFIQADVADPARAAAVVDEAHERLGGLELVIANAGFGNNKHGARLRVEDVVPVFQVCAIGAAATLTAAIPHMLQAGRGHLVGVSSIAGIRGLPTSAAYSGAKAALSMFLESLRLDLRQSGIRVTDIRPGFVDTPLTKKNRFPMPFLVPAEEAGRLIVRAIEREKRVYTFPWPMAVAARIMAIIPGFLWEWAGSRTGAKIGGATPG